MRWTVTYNMFPHMNSNLKEKHSSCCIHTYMQRAEKVKPLHCLSWWVHLRSTHIQVLSLSNNSLRDLESFKPLVNLVEVNVNFNAITSLHGLVCPNLRRLYLSNNLIASTERLAVSYPKLQTLCLFKNMLPNLASALEPLR